MENYMLENDISLICVEADSFPNGVMAAHGKLHSLFPNASERAYYGLSRPENGTIVYKAAAEEMEQGEAEKLGQEAFVLKKGTYISVFVADFLNDPTAIGIAFQELIAQPGIDPNGFCVEMYLGETDVRCMVRLMD